MNTSGPARLLKLCGFGAVGIAFVGWLYLAAEVNRAGFGHIPLSCLLSTRGACSILYGIVQFQNGLLPLIPVCFWVGAVLLLLGLVLSAGAGRSSRPLPTYDPRQWEALLRYDEEVRRVAETLRKIGPEYEGLFAREYMQVNDRRYLHEIADRVIKFAMGSPEDQGRAR